MGLFDGIISATGLDNVSQGGGSMLGGLLGGVGSYIGQQSTNEANAAQADKQMQFQRESRATAYQTAVEDMKAAGLNPMLAYQQGGAGNQPGAQAQMQSALGAGVTTAAHGLSKIQETKNLASQNELISSQIDDTNAAASLKRATAITEAYRPGLTKAQTEEILTKAGLNKASTRHTTALGVLAERGKAPTSDRPVYQDVKDMLKDMSSADQIRKFGKFINKMPSVDDGLPNTMR
jgi:hypothetical protein